MVISDLLNVRRYIGNYKTMNNKIILNPYFNKRFVFNENQLVENKIPTFHGYKFDDFYINFNCEIFTFIVLGISTVAMIKKYT